MTSDNARTTAGLPSPAERGVRRHRSPRCDAATTTALRTGYEAGSQIPVLATEQDLSCYPVRACLIEDGVVLRRGGNRAGAGSAEPAPSATPSSGRGWSPPTPGAPASARWPHSTTSAPPPPALISATPVSRYAPAAGRDRLTPQGRYATDVSRLRPHAVRSPAMDPRSGHQPDDLPASPEDQPRHAPTTHEGDKPDAQPQQVSHGR